MTERDAFEARFAAAVHAYAGRLSSELDPVELAHRIAVREPRRHGLSPAMALRGVSFPARVWMVLLLAALLTGLVAGMLVAGARPPELPAVVPPSIPLSACPAGTNPDVPGPADQARPAWGVAQTPEMAFDRHEGKLVAVADGGTWTFDVCTNTWAHLQPNRQPPGANNLVYDIDSALTVASDSDGRMWAYDLGADTWTAKGQAPFDPGTIRLWFYEPSSGRIVALEDDRTDNQTLGFTPWGYDVATDSWIQLRQGASVVIGAHYQFFTFEPSTDRVIAYVSTWTPSGSADWRFDARTWLYDVADAAWSRTGAVTPPVFNHGMWGLSPGIGYDEAAARAVMVGQGHLATYDVTADRWEVLFGGLTEGVPDSCGTRPECRQMPRMVYDSVNERLVVFAGYVGTPTGELWPDDLLAFETRTGAWTVLLEAR
ncbi:MAG TPA: hypothetical protein VJ506_05560 [Candidatus Limnocylindrales bacterium]|nr:hypothetical protein [Candidatus Limnocylindrales bacterium]